VSRGVVWHGDRVLGEVQGQMKQNMTRACLHLRGVVINSIGEPGPPAGPPSAKGDPPHKRIGHLRRNIDWEVSPSGLEGRVGTNVEYGRYLEKGTRTMAMRPYLRPALDKEQRRIVAILAGKG